MKGFGLILIILGAILICLNIIADFTSPGPGKKETILKSNATLLKKFGGKVVGMEKFENTIIIPPVSIAEGCKIQHSIIGPNVTIGEFTTIDSSIIKDSIIGSYAELEEVVLKSSIIGNDAYVRGLSQSLNIGDNTEIDLG